MIEMSHTEVWGMRSAIRGMRNPMNSWAEMDSQAINDIGIKDRTLMVKLVAAGTDHGKFMRMIHVQTDIYAPLYWWKEFDTYKVGTTANSCSTMHKLASRPLQMSDFSVERLKGGALDAFSELVSQINACRELFLNSGDKDYWYQMIQMLPTSYNQLRTVDLNYEVIKRMYHARKNHKLYEWRVFCEDWVPKLPCSELLTEVVSK